MLGVNLQDASYELVYRVAFMPGISRYLIKKKIGWYRANTLLKVPFYFILKGCDIIKILLEYIIVFIIIWLMNYFLLVKNKLKYKKKEVPTELLYLKKIYKINIKKINYKSFVYTYTIINSFIISTIYIILMYLLDNWILRIIIGVILLVLLIIICYGLLGRYYLKKEGRE